MARSAGPGGAFATVQEIFIYIALISNVHQCVCVCVSGSCFPVLVHS